MDEAILGWFTAKRSPQLIEFAEIITVAGNTIVLSAAAVILALVLIRTEEYRAAAFYLMCCILSAVLNFGLKILVDRARPESYYAPGMEELTASFPSGHALMSTVIYGCFAWLAFRDKPIALVGVGVLIFLIGLSRLILGVHYPSDVFTGWVIGAWVIVSVAALFDPRQRVSTPEPPSS